LPNRRIPEGSCVLIAAPYGSDASNIGRLLDERNLHWRACPTPEAIAEHLNENTGVVLVTDEALRGDLSTLRGALDRQAEWSDTPFILLVARNVRRPGGAELARLALGDLTTNLIVL
jgi:hypothetical protein